MATQPQAPQIYPQVVKQTEINDTMSYYLFWKQASDMLQKMKETHPSIDFNHIVVGDLLVKQFEEFCLLRKIRSHKAEKEKIETARMLKKLDSFQKSII